MSMLFLLYRGMVDAALPLVMSGCPFVVVETCCWWMVVFCPFVRLRSSVGGWGEERCARFRTRDAFTTCPHAGWQPDGVWARDLHENSPWLAYERAHVIHELVVEGVAEEELETTLDCLL